MTDTKPATGSGLKEFLDWAVKRGEINSSTGNAQRVASTKVLASEDDPDGVDIRALDVERLLDRFENLNRTNYSSASLATYKTRFRNAVAMYLAWLDGDPTWKNVLRPRRTSASSHAGKDASTKTVDVDTGLPGQTRSSSHDHQSYARVTSAPTVTYQLPIRPDLLVQIQLPVDLTPNDAERVAAFVRSLAFESPASTRTREADLDENDQGD